MEASIKSINTIFTSRQRKIAAMAWFDGVPQNEIAVRLGIHPVSVCRTLRRARLRAARHGFHLPKFSRTKPRLHAAQLSACEAYGGV